MIQAFYVFSNWAFLALRVILGVVFLVHGCPKISNLGRTSEGFDSMGFKPGRFWGTFVAVLEFVGGLCLIVGLFVQPLSLLFAIEMVVVTLWVKLKMGLVNGYELDLVILGGALVLMTVGGGVFTLDRFLGIVLY